MAPVGSYVFNGVDTWRSMNPDLPEIVQGTTTGNPRDDLVYGEYKPSTTTTGSKIPEGELDTYIPAGQNEAQAMANNTVSIPAGTDLSGKKVYGDVTFQGAATGEDVWFVGGAHVPTSNVGVLACTNSRSGIVSLKDFTIKPQREALNRDGVLGKQFELYRGDISGGVDGVGIYSTITTSPGNQANVKVYGCYIHDLVYIIPDYKNGVSGAVWHEDGTHNDCIQIQGGRNIHVMGNFLEGTGHKLPGTGDHPTEDWIIDAGYCMGAGVIVTNGAGGGVDSTIVVEQNWISHSKAALNVKINMPYIARNNRISIVTAYADDANPFTPSGKYIRCDYPAASITTIGLTTNRWDDGPLVGQLMTTANGGIYNNPP